MKGNAKTGFTLVEIVVVLVILAILAAILIPSMAGWIDKARQGEALAEARACLVAAEGIAVDRYAAGSAYALANDKAETKTLAEVPAATDILRMDFDGRANPKAMTVLASNGLYVLYENGKYSFSNTAGGTFSDKTALEKVYTAIQSAGVSANGQFISSGNNVTAAIQQKLNEAGVDPTAAGATSWAVRFGAMGQYPKLYWTTQDISTKNAGDKVYVMTYTFGTEHYNVWQSTVGVKNPGGERYLMNEVNGSMQTSQDPNLQTYDNMIQKYNELCP